MNRFDDKGMMIIPNRDRSEIKSSKKLIVLTELFCPHGHNLIQARANFNGYPGLVLQASAGKQNGILALSPVYGEKIRVSFDIDLKKNEVLSLKCTVCQAELPTYAQCQCGADLKALFLTKDMSFSNCVGICNRVDCRHAQLFSSGELISLAAAESL